MDDKTMLELADAMRRAGVHPAIVVHAMNGCDVMVSPSQIKATSDLLAERIAASHRRLLDALEGLVSCIQETRGPRAYAALIQSQQAIKAAAEIGKGMGRG